MKPVLLVDCYNGDLPGAAYYEAWLTDPATVIRPPHERRSIRLRDHSGIVVGGSAASVAEPEPWMDDVIEILRGALTLDLPILGCCFGHQVLAWAAAGPHAVRRAPRAEVGYPEVVVTSDDPVLASLGPRLTPFVSHEDEVVAVPELEVLAHTSACAVHALRVRGRRAWGVQFHVEYPRAEQERILTYRAQKHPELGLDPAALLARAPEPGAHARALFAAFEHVVRASDHLP